jgi:hypothetical protein
MGEVIVLDRVVRGIDQHAGIPDLIGPAMAYGRGLDALEDDAAALAVLAPTKIRIVKIA